ncbi:hypothetical protein D3C76_814110 [compost metagenome]
MMSKVSCFLADADSRIKGLASTARKKLPKPCRKAAHFSGASALTSLVSAMTLLSSNPSSREYFLKASTSTDAP